MSDVRRSLQEQFFPQLTCFGCGPANDKGWSEAHHEAGKYVEKKLPGTRLIFVCCRKSGRIRNYQFPYRKQGFIIVDPRRQGQGIW